MCSSSRANPSGRLILYVRGHCWGLNHQTSSSTKTLALIVAQMLGFCELFCQSGWVDYMVTIVNLCSRLWLCCPMLIIEVCNGPCIHCIKCWSCERYFTQVLCSLSFIALIEINLWDQKKAILLMQKFAKQRKQGLPACWMKALI